MRNDHNPSFMVVNYREAEANFNDVANQNAQDLCKDKHNC